MLDKLRPERSGGVGIGALYLPGQGDGGPGVRGGVNGGGGRSEG